jgi:hypothetical protein
MVQRCGDFKFWKMDGFRFCMDNFLKVNYLFLTSFFNGAKVSRLVILENGRVSLLHG